jgi:amino acid adenylation domain-containing protein/non-ribosomal peptide synthase protein (TIGR01720 family)
VKQTALDAYAHQDLPFEMLVDTLHPHRDLSRNPLFQVAFQLFNAPRKSSEGKGAVAMSVQRGTSIFDLICRLTELERGLQGEIEYATDLFEAATIERMSGHYARLLDAILTGGHKRISELPMLGPEERHRVVTEWNATEVPSDAAGRAIHELFEAQVALTPEALAVVFGSERLTYAALDERANRLARYLRERGVAPEALVALCLERSIDMVVAVVAVFKAGGAYVPLDPRYPRERLSYMLDDAQPRLLLTQASLADALPPSQAERVLLDLAWPDVATRSSEPLPERSGPGNLAYVIYTSGSTGWPKGVMVQHGGVCNVARSQVRLLGVRPSDRVLQFASLSFDASIFEIVMALCAGASLWLADREQVMPGPGLTDFLAANDISVVVLPPSALTVTPPADLASLRLVTVAGEACPPGVVARWHAGRRFFNLYGPTEGTIWASYAECANGDALPPIGRPIDNVRLYVLDRRRQPVPIGVPGELYIGGAGVGRGYLNRPELTDASFVPDPFAAKQGARMYATGDLVRYRADGNLEYLGRVDHQVKIRGYRIELTEIEAALREHAGVQTAVVTASEHQGSRRLVAYVVPDPAYRGIDPEEHSWDVEQISSWQNIYNEVYACTAADSTADFTGWNSSYTGQPIPRAQMEEWLGHIVDRILGLEPKRVLEIGAGTGLVLFRVAGGCDEYVATDFSHTALSRLQPQIASRSWSHVRLLERWAHDIADLPRGHFDTVILNSVVQYFPGIDYLLTVLDGVFELLAPRGTVFLGDIRNLRLLEAFHSSIELSRAHPGQTAHSVRHRVRRRVAHDNELVVDPDFFFALGHRYPSLSEVQVALKHGKEENELTSFRYDVTLRNGTRDAIPARCVDVDWRQVGPSLGRLDELLHDHRDEAVVVRDIPNGRVAHCVRLMDLLNSRDCPSSVGAIRESPLAASLIDVDPEDVRELGARRDRRVDLSCAASSRADTFDAVFWSAARPRGLRVCGEQVVRSWSEYANDPLHALATQRLLPLLRRHLEARLPDYMVPAGFVVLERLPLTPNGKVDRQALPAPDTGRPELEAAYVAPATPAEVTLAGIWAEVLGLEQVGVRDNFFELGGDSILSIQIVARAKDAGLPLTPPMLFQHQTIAGLAAAAASRPAVVTAAEDGELSGAVPLLPITQWWLEGGPVEASHFNQAVLFAAAGIEASLLSRALAELQRHHDALRLRLWHDDEGWRQAYTPAAEEPVPVAVVDLTAVAAPEAAIERHTAAWQASLDLAAGRLLVGGVFERGPGAAPLLFLAAHHVAVDGVTWRVLLEDLETVYGQLRAAQPVRLPAKTSSLRQWAAGLAAWAAADEAPAAADYWRGLAAVPWTPLPQDAAGENLEGTATAVTVQLSAEDTTALLQQVPAAYRTQIQEVLVTAVAGALAEWSGAGPVWLNLEGHGREEVAATLDVSRTAGWFTSLFPVAVAIDGTVGPGPALQRIKEQLRAVPQRGLSYGVLRYLSPDADVRVALQRLPVPEVSFNYLGQLDRAAGPRFQTGPARSPRQTRRHLLEIDGSVQGGALELHWTYSPARHRPETIARVAAGFLRRLRELIAHCLSPEAGGYTPSDFVHARVSKQDLDKLLDRLQARGETHH